VLNPQEIEKSFTDFLLLQVGITPLFDRLPITIMLYPKDAASLYRWMSKG